MRKIASYASYGSWVVALTATFGSLYASEIAHFPPCVLCWYQRICMYPLVIIIAIGILKKDKLMPLYVFPFSIIGLIIGLYHVLLYYHIIPNSVAPCIQGISCTTKYIEWFGFITIPFLSLVSFVTITILMYLSFRYSKKK
ncbi:MAG: disulfide bond formation protein B [Candidatus Levybacteria bacterium]|nr:disulfide bond formation protein B [Candidatus Levybacteria bacterium]